jgi:hypothetical protein
MTQDRADKIQKEGLRRMIEWSKNASFKEMTFYYSRMKFDMNLGLCGGFPFDEPEWMKGLKFNSFVTKDEFYSNEYDQIIDSLFKYGESNWNNLAKIKNHFAK